jgi:hypothetical protein
MELWDSARLCTTMCLPQLRVMSPYQHFISGNYDSLKKTTPTSVSLSSLPLEWAHSNLPHHWRHLTDVDIFSFKSTHFIWILGAFIRRGHFQLQIDLPPELTSGSIYQMWTFLASNRPALYVLWKHLSDMDTFRFISIRFMSSGSIYPMWTLFPSYRSTITAPLPRIYFSLITNINSGN